MGGSQKDGGGDDQFGFVMGIVLIAIATIVGLAFLQGQVAALLRG
jgi:hypothetical protein